MDSVRGNWGDVQSGVSAQLAGCDPGITMKTANKTGVNTLDANSMNYVNPLIRPDHSRFRPILNSTLTIDEFQKPSM